jgi:peptidoglycan/LPS O-acetylase OafA/YrhL
MEKSNRIQILDGLRVLAIMMVMIFHYYARYQGIFYTYNFKVPGIIYHGRLGVQLFFIISGFVITLTLSKSQTFMEFIKKRFIRLIPGMIICATFTFLFFWVFDKNNLLPECKNFGNLLLSYTFVSPPLINDLFGTNYNYIDGVYWTIWTELQFYLIGGIIYFLSPKHFLRNYLITVVVSVPIWYLFKSPHFFDLTEKLVGHDRSASFREFFNVFNLFQNNCWFLAGIVLNKLYFKKRREPKLIFLFAAIFVFQMALVSNRSVTAVCTVFFILLILFLFKPEYISFLANRTLSKIGVASYSIYLIHENVGFLIMNRLAGSFQSWNWTIPIFLIILSTVFALLSYKYLEKPFSVLLRKSLLANLPLQAQNIPVVSSLPIEISVSVSSAASV